MEKAQSLAEELQEKLAVNKATCQCSEERTKRELECLQQRFKAAFTLFRYLKIQAKASADLNMACAFFRIKHQEGVGFVDGHSMPLSKWSKNANISEFESSAEEAAEANDDWYAADIFSLVRMITFERVTTKIDEMEISVKLALNTINKLAEQLNNFEQEAAVQRERATDYEQEAAIQRARATECAQEAAMQRERANEHEQEAAMQRKRATESARELFLLKQKFAAFKSEAQLVFRRIEALASSLEQRKEKLISKTLQLHDEKALKEDKVQELMNENVRLQSLVDQKEAQLVALNEQLKLTSLSERDK
uniref:Uncharacterized protein n=1 Tax=Ananas comosus var. bracteatus TaxID=296719 RepID=A0A6V7QKE1_ANACO|nr:unnamed protein product [Ananas comosus var. bracteatus]